MEDRNANVASVRPSVMSASRVLFTPGIRYAATNASKVQATTPDEALEILKSQRARRPVSPHLTIYKPPLNMVMSALHRNTGVLLGLGVYGFFVGYVGLPLVGLSFDAASVAATFGALPLLVKIPAKFVTSWFFTFHSFNGIRHLVWDTARELTMKGVNRTGWTVVGLSVISSLILTFM